MGKWGWMLVSIGCIVLIYSQTYEAFETKMTILGIGLFIIVIGGIMTYMDLKKNKQKK